MADGLGNHAPDWEPSATDLPSDALGLADIEEFAAVEGKRQTNADMREAFGPPKVEVPNGFEEDGTPIYKLVPEDSPEAAGHTRIRWQIDMKNPENRGKYKELSDPHRRALSQRNKKWNQSARKVVMKNRTTGEARLVFEEHRESIGRKGFRDVVVARGARIERGPDGMLFRWLSGWMPTGRTCIGTPLSGDGIATGTQRDPEGVEWIRDDSGEWVTTAQLYARKAV